MDRESKEVERSREEEEEEAQAQVDVWKYVFGFVDMAVVKCAIELGIADALESHQGPMTLSELSSALGCSQSALYRIMRFLVHCQIFREESTGQEGSKGYVPTRLSRLLMGNNREKNMAAFVLLESSPVMLAPWHSLSARVLAANGVPAAFEAAHGKDLWSYAATNPVHSKLFNDAMACDSRVAVPAVIDGCPEIFHGLDSLVDVGGGNGCALRLLVKAFPWIRGINFDLPHVISNNSKSCDGVEHVGGSMFDGVPKADAVFLKWVLHDWGDDECIHILKNCREAIPEEKGRVIIVEAALEEEEVDKLEHVRLMLDMVMMAHTNQGKERTLKEWAHILSKAGFSRYTVKRIKTVQFVIEAYPNRWLTVKKKLKAVDGSNCVGQKMSKKGSDRLDTIHEDLDTANMTSQDHPLTSLTVEWAHQRLPFPIHWFLSPISTINIGKHADLPSASNIASRVQDITGFLEVAKGGLFFLLGIEVMTPFVSTEIQSPVWSVPITWKLHSLSVVLLLGMGVLEDEKSRDVYETLQEVYGKYLDELWSSKSKEFILEGNKKVLAETGEKASVEFFRFQSEIHESYSTFMETLVEQFASVSYGDLIYGRQVASYLHRCVESPVWLAAWKALSNARVLELLPPLENCFAKAEGYLEPIEDNESIVEAYVKSWVSGALDRAATRGSATFTLVLHHLSSFIFLCSTSEKISLRNKLVKSLLRDYSRKQQHEGMMLDFIQHQKAGQREGSLIERRFKILTEACEGNPSLVRDVEN